MGPNDGKKIRSACFPNALSHGYLADADSEIQERPDSFTLLDSDSSPKRNGPVENAQPHSQRNTSCQQGAAGFPSIKSNGSAANGPILPISLAWRMGAAILPSSPQYAAAALGCNQL